MDRPTPPQLHRPTCGAAATSPSWVFDTSSGRRGMVAARPGRPWAWGSDNPVHVSLPCHVAGRRSVPLGFRAGQVLGAHLARFAALTRDRERFGTPARSGSRRLSAATDCSRAVPAEARESPPSVRIPPLGEGGGAMSHPGSVLRDQSALLHPAGTIPFGRHVSIDADSSRVARIYSRNETRELSGRAELSAASTRARRRQAREPSSRS